MGVMTIVTMMTVTTTIIAALPVGVTVVVPSTVVLARADRITTRLAAAMAGTAQVTVVVSAEMMAVVPAETVATIGATRPMATAAVAARVVMTAPVAMTVTVAVQIVVASALGAHSLVVMQPSRSSIA